jgi:hypothetical protein
MKNPLIYLAIAALLAACRGGSSGSLQRKGQQSYDVVQEGQASGVTSTINAPGEPLPPPVAMTGTNADTTSNFALPQVATSTTSTGQPGTIAGTLPQDTSGSMISGYPTAGAPPMPRPRATPRPQQPAVPATRTDTTSTTLEGPPPSTSTISPNTDTAPPPPGDMTGTTAPKEKKEKEKKPSDENPPPPTQTDTQPPPTSTTTGV